MGRHLQVIVFAVAITAAALCTWVYATERIMRVEDWSKLNVTPGVAGNTLFANAQRADNASSDASSFEVYKVSECDSRFATKEAVKKVSNEVTGLSDRLTEAKQDILQALKTAVDQSLAESQAQALRAKITEEVKQELSREMNEKLEKMRRDLREQVIKELEEKRK